MQLKQVFKTERWCSCSECAKVFKTYKACTQHKEDTHNESDEDCDLEMLSPPVDTDGEWVTLRHFNGRKSFGYFKCTGCQNIWTSAHSFKDYTQDCKKCDDSEYPTYMWQNANKGDRQAHKVDDNKKPHDKARCEACRAGECLCEDEYIVSNRWY